MHGTISLPIKSFQRSSSYNGRRKKAGRGGWKAAYKRQAKREARYLPVIERAAELDVPMMWVARDLTGWRQRPFRACSYVYVQVEAESEDTRESLLNLLNEAYLLLNEQEDDYDYYYDGYDDPADRFVDEESARDYLDSMDIWWDD